MTKKIILLSAIVIMLIIASVFAYKIYEGNKIFTVPGKAIFNESLIETNNAGI